MANGLWFTEEDVRHELEKLGFKDVSDKGLQSFSEGILSRDHYLNPSR